MNLKVHTIILRFIFAARENHGFDMITEQLGSRGQYNLVEKHDTNLVVTH